MTIWNEIIADVFNKLFLWLRQLKGKAACEDTGIYRIRYTALQPPHSAVCHVDTSEN